jgi:hypothetical protein
LLPLWHSGGVTLVTASFASILDTVPRRMKRFIQIVALVVAALLMAQPALANVSCPRENSGSDCSAFNCCEHAGGMPTKGISSDEAMGPMGQMDSTSAGCQMQWHAALPEPGARAAAKCKTGAGVAPQIPATTQRELPGAVSFVEVRQADGGVVGNRTQVRPAGAAAASASARYILFGVFRI